MKCVYCSANKTSITNSRSTKSQTQTWRRHYCTKCKRSFSSFEKPDMNHLAIKKSDSLSPYHRSKLYLSLTRSFQNQEPNYHLLDNLIDSIEVKLLAQASQTIPASTLYELVLQTLKPISKSAYLHYLAAHTN